MGIVIYTEAQFEAIVILWQYIHWIITPNLTRSIQLDLWPGGPKSHLWQSVIASPVIQQAKMEELQTAVSALLGLVSVAIDMAWHTDGNCWMTGIPPVSTPNRTLLVSTEAGREASSRKRDCALYGRMGIVTLKSSVRLW